jgi:hypothetical protein
MAPGWRAPSPLPVAEPECQSKLHSILTGVGHSNKSNFIYTLHKKSKRDSPTPESCPASSKHNTSNVNPFRDMFGTSNGKCSIGMNLSKKIGFFSFVNKLRRIRNLDEHFLIDSVVKGASFKVLTM